MSWSGKKEKNAENKRNTTKTGYCCYWILFLVRNGKYSLDMREILLKIRKYSQNGGHTMRSLEKREDNYLLLVLTVIAIWIARRTIFFFFSWTVGKRFMKIFGWYVSFFFSISFSSFFLASFVFLSLSFKFHHFDFCQKNKPEHVWFLGFI